MKKTKLRKLWSKEPCVKCGTEGYATRTAPRPISERYICGDCEMWERGYQDGLAATAETLKEGRRLLAIGIAFVRKAKNFKDEKRWLDTDVPAWLKATAALVKSPR